MGGRLSRQALPMLAAAALLLPAIIVLALWFGNQQRLERAAVERAAMATARQILAAAEAETTANRRIVRLLAVSPAMRDLSELGSTLERLVQNNRGWTALMLRDRRTGEVLLERADSPDTVPLRPLPAQIPQEGLVEGAFDNGRYCPCVVTHMALPDQPDRVLSLYVTPDRYQSFLTRYPSGSALTGLVDQSGRFAGSASLGEQELNL